MGGPSTLRLEPSRLPELAISRPGDALRDAHAVIGSTKDPLALSYADQAAGIVLRDRGDTATAIRHLRRALREATASGMDARVPDVRATLGTTLATAGRSRSGLAQLDRAVAESSGDVVPRVLMRRAHVCSGLGRYDEALTDLRRAIAGLRALDDTYWEALALNNRSAVHVWRGALHRAEADARHAEHLFAASGREIEATGVLVNRGAIASSRGDLPRALALYDEAARRCSDLGLAWPEVALDRVRLLLAAGLASDARRVAAAALDERSVSAASRAELQYAASLAALSDGDVATALDEGRAARSAFRHQERDWWLARTELVLLRARFARGDRGAALAVIAGDVGRRLEATRSEDAPVALLLAGRLAAEHEPDLAHAHLVAAARYRRRASPLVRATGWLAQALDRELADDSRGVFAACGRGLDALDEHRETLGSSELRALATGHGQDLAALAVRRAVRDGGARRLLRWSERWRATTLAQPPVRPPKDGDRADRLGLLRSHARRLDEARAERDDPAAVERERVAWEQAVRHERHLLAGAGRATTPALDVGVLVEQLGATTLVELLEIDGTLLAITVRAGRVSVTEVGPVGPALAAVDAARFVLRQAGRGRPVDLTGVGERLGRTLLGSVPRGDGPLVVAPPSRLHAVPWSLVPGLAERPVTVVPSARMWQRASAAPEPERGRTVLIAGPGLRTGGAEVDVLAAAEPPPLLLRDGAATVERSLAALDGARLAHVAAHGHFRPDSPMFSSLVLDDGPLTVYDLESLDRAPHRLVLSACDSGVMVPVGADELLGLSSALLAMGTVGVVSSVAEVNDEATVPFMLDLHAGLTSGAGLGEVLLGARTRARGDQVGEATAAAFVALGV